MRRVFFLLSLLLLPLKVLALYNGNPSAPMMPEVGIFIPQEVWFGVKTGYAFDRVYDRKLHMSGQHLQHCNKRVQKYESLSNFGVLTLNFYDRVEIFGDVGVTSFDLWHHPFPESKVSYHTGSRFTWGVGGRAIIAYWGNLQFALNAEYFRSNPPLSSLEVNGKAYPARHSELHFTEWQVGAGFSYRVDWFIPYIGVDFANFRIHIDHLDAIEFLIPSGHVTFKENYPAGLFLGFGMAPHRAFSMNVELRFFNENAVSVSADIKF